MISEAKITKVQVKDSRGFNPVPLWDGATGRKTDLKVPVGSTWELRITVYGKADAAGWSAAVSVVADGVPDARLKQAKAIKVYETAKTIPFDIEMGKKLDTPVTLKITFWASDYLNLPSGYGLPPKESW